MTSQMWALCSKSFCRHLHSWYAGSCFKVIVVSVLVLFHSGCMDMISGKRFIMQALVAWTCQVMFVNDYQMFGVLFAMFYVYVFRRWVLV